MQCVPQREKKMNSGDITGRRVKNPNEGVRMWVCSIELLYNSFISSYSNKLKKEKICRNWGESWLIEGRRWAETKYAF